ncbi:hypothetical protein RDI58_000498 [Solanum bulbocastanum]|uniref:Uncharacterized protein n=1 Tax=Solanum bulbocastanum TaxID=147425 RepID=A0AAN8UA91_SOLBU
MNAVLFSSKILFLAFDFQMFHYRILKFCSLCRFLLNQSNSLLKISSAAMLWDDLLSVNLQFFLAIASLFQS